MGRFQNTKTGVVITVDDSKDDRFAGALWGPVSDAGAKKAPAKSDNK